MTSSTPASASWPKKTGSHSGMSEKQTACVMPVRLLVRLSVGLSDTVELDLIATQMLALS